MLPLLLLAGAARGAEMMAAMPQATNAHREEAAAASAADQWAAPAAEKWAAAEPQYYYTPEGYLHQRSDGDQYLSGGAVAAGPWVTGELRGTFSVKKGLFCVSGYRGAAKGVVRGRVFSTSCYIC